MVAATVAIARLGLAVQVTTYGPAFNDGGPSGYTSTGGTGYSVRTLVELAAAAS